MIYDLQKASIFKRFSAFLLDFILICILATGFAALLSLIVNFDDSYKQVVEYSEHYKEIGVDPSTIAGEQYEALTDEEKETFHAYANALSSAISKAFLMISVGLFLAHLITEFVIPLCLKNGQTVGKKIFSVGVMQVNGIKLSPIALFVRAILGKYAIETMVLLSLMLIFFFISNSLWLFIVFVALYIFQIVLFFASKRYAFIHDALSSSVVIDMQTQMIFDTKEEMIAYKEELHRQEVEKAENN